MELYAVIAVINRCRSEELISYGHSIQLPLIVTQPGRGTAKEQHLSRYGLEAAEKTIFSTVAKREQAEALFAFARKKLFVEIPGNGIIFAIPLKSVAGRRTLAYFFGGYEPEGAVKMVFEQELIVVLFNDGQAECVMEAACAAGAEGGTLLQVQEHNCLLPSQLLASAEGQKKELLYILTGSAKKSAIMKAISEKCGSKTPVGAMAFSLPVSSVEGWNPSNIQNIEIAKS